MSGANLNCGSKGKRAAKCTGNTNLVANMEIQIQNGKQKSAEIA